jgi:PHD/YefM family antitoxin component YafN of YafNO toxin-antitoxin module
MLLLLQEYTAEIERLRRDLAATRDKTGVYLASDNYTQMIMQLEHQEQEISQNLAHIKALKEELDKKEASSDTVLSSFEDSLFRVDYGLLWAFTLVKHSQIIRYLLSTVRKDVITFCMK